MNEDMGVLTLFPGSFIGGSWIIDPKTATDIDIVVPWWAFDLGIAVANGFELNETDYVVPELAYVLRKGKINLLVVRNEYVVAYKAAVREMLLNPELYVTREQRINLHQSFKRVIRVWLGEEYEGEKS